VGSNVDLRMNCAVGPHIGRTVRIAAPAPLRAAGGPLSQLVLRYAGVVTPTPPLPPDARGSSEPALSGLAADRLAAAISSAVTFWG
jgi:hypothetical protein